MNDEQRRQYLESYRRDKERGPPFFPDILAKDAVVSLLVFMVLVGLAFFVGAPLEDRADPNATAYTPKPEWYFLFLFQLLKYFPGKLEVVGVFVLPILAILALLALPWLDRSPLRHYLGRPIVSGMAVFAVVGVALLTTLAILEAPPPQEKATGDATAALYAANCAACHGPSIEVSPGANLHEVIASGNHEGMPAWSSDLTTDQIDALAGFILSPAGSRLFTQECGACHEAPELVAGDPLELKNSLSLGPDFGPHAAQDVPVWQKALSAEERTALLNFLAAPDGQRLFATNCSPCHGRSVAFADDPQSLEAIIKRGGLHLEMPPWQERLSAVELESLAAYVVDPETAPQGAALFQGTCSACHGERIPAASDVEAAREAIASGGTHETMPIWGDILTAEQLAALTSYTLEAAAGVPLEVGSELYAKNCAACHGDFGEGGLNPTRPGDVIAPISSAEYLKTRDDATLRAVIARGQPNFGMSPFGTSFGGPLDERDINAIVTYLRAWEAKPPVELPPEVALTPISVSGEQIYAEVCSQCHGPGGEGLVGPALRDPSFQAANSDQQIFDTINLGHPATAMIGWGEILTAEQIQQLVAYLRQLASEAAPPATPASVPSFTRDVAPVLQQGCGFCHGSLGGWDASTYDSVIESGDNGPAVIPGDPQGSLLARKLLGTQSAGSLMPPAGSLPQNQVQLILDWIAGGAPDN